MMDFMGVLGMVLEIQRDLEKSREKILEMGSALDMTVCNTFLQTHDSQHRTCPSGPSKIEINYIHKDRKRVRDVKVIPREEVAWQEQLFVFDIMIGAVKKVEKSFTPKRKVWRLKNATRMDLKMSFRDQFMQLVKLPMLKNFGNRLRRTYWHLQLLTMVEQGTTKAQGYLVME